MQVNNSLVELNEQVLQGDEKKLFDYFIEEYYKDFDAYLACIRMGVNKTLAFRCSQDFLRSQYVQRYIAEHPILGKLETKEDKDRAFMYVASKLQNISQTGSNKDKLEACKQISSMYGLNQPIDVNSTGAFINVIQSVQPISEDDWENQSLIRANENKKD